MKIKIAQIKYDLIKNDNLVILSYFGIKILKRKY